MKAFKLLKKAAINWYGNDPFSQAAAISYYTIFSFPALAFIYLALASVFSNEAELQNQIVNYMSHIVGQEGAQNMQNIIESTSPKQKNFWALAIGVVILIFAALKLFLQLQKTLNMIWRVKVPDHVSIWSVVKQRFIALSVMLGIGFIMVSSLVITAIVTALGDYVTHSISQLMPFIRIVNFVISLTMLSLLFTVLLKMLPDVEIPWKPAFTGGFATGIMFIIGEHMIGLYFQLAEPGSAYGATASIILLMLWVSYTCVILLFGAELTKVVLEDVYSEKAKPTDISELKTKKA